MNLCPIGEDDEKYAGDAENDDNKDDWDGDMLRQPPNPGSRKLAFPQRRMPRLP